MKTYGITYSLLGGGYIEIKAKSKTHAEEILFEKSAEKLIQAADFEDSLVVEFIELLD